MLTDVNLNDVARDIQPVHIEHVKIHDFYLILGMITWVG